MSEGTFGLSRRKCTLSNWRAMTCWMAPPAAFRWQPAAFEEAWTGDAGSARPTGTMASNAVTRVRHVRPSLEVPRIIGVLLEKLEEAGRGTGLPGLLKRRLNTVRPAPARSHLARPAR